MHTIHEAHPVRDEGSVIVFEGVEEHSSGADVVLFAVDHSQAEGAAAAAEDGLALLVEPWQVIARLVEEHNPWGPSQGYEGPFEDPRLGEPDPPAWVDRI